MAIGIAGTEFVIEYNEIYNVCNETADAGAIYGGRYPHLRDNYIRYNYFHDIANRINMGYAINTVYFDDLWSAAEVYSNVFYNVERAALIGGGRDSEFKNNIFIDCGSSIYIDSRGEKYVDNMEEFRKTDIYRNIFYSPFRSEKWKKAFPEIYNMFEIPGEGFDSESFEKTTLKNEAFLPAGNSIIENVYINTNLPGFSDTAKELTTVDNNIVIQENDVNNVFYDYNNRYFGVKSDSVLYEQLKNFDDLKFDLIGVQR